MKFIVSEKLAVFLCLSATSSMLVSAKPKSSKDSKDTIDEGLPNNLRDSDNSKTMTNQEPLDVDKSQCVSNGAGCNSNDDCCSGYCIGHSTTVTSVGVIESNLKVCVECLTDYDCPASISCGNAMTVAAMCDWGSQKTFPGIDNIRKGYNIFKGDPLNYEFNKDPGWDTQGNVLTLDYMNGATYTVMSETLYDIPGGYFVDVDERCQFDFASTEISTSYEYEKSVGKKVGVEASGTVKGVELGGSFGAGAGKYFKESKSSRFLTTRTEAKCLQYNIEMDHENIPSLDTKFETYLKKCLDEETNPTVAYYEIFERMGTHAVSDAYMGSMIGATLTLSEQNQAEIKKGKTSVSAGLSIGVPGLFSIGVKESTTTETKETTTLKENNQSIKKFTLGSSAFTSIEDWSKGSKLNPEIIDVTLISLCDVIPETTTNFVKTECEEAMIPYCANYLGIDPFDCGFIKGYKSNAESWSEAMETCQSHGKTLPSTSQICGKTKNSLYPDNWFPFSHQLYTTDSLFVYTETTDGCESVADLAPDYALFEVYCVDTPNEEISYTYHAEIPAPADSANVTNSITSTEWVDGPCDDDAVTLPGDSGLRAYEVSLDDGDITIEQIDMKSNSFSFSQYFNEATFIVCKDSVLMGGTDSYVEVSGCTKCTGAGYEDANGNWVQMCSNQPSGDYLRIEWEETSNTVGFCQLILTGGPTDWYQPLADTDDTRANPKTKGLPY